MDYCKFKINMLVRPTRKASKLFQTIYQKTKQPFIVTSKNGMRIICRINCIEYIFLPQELTNKGIPQNE